MDRRGRSATAWLIISELIAGLIKRSCHKFRISKQGCSEIGNRCCLRKKTITFQLVRGYIYNVLKRVLHLNFFPQCIVRRSAKGKSCWNGPAIDCRWRGHPKQELYLVAFLNYGKMALFCAHSSILLFRGRVQIRTDTGGNRRFTHKLLHTNTWD